MKIMRSIAYSLIIGLVAGLVVPAMFAGYPAVPDQKSTFKKVINAKWFKIGVGVTTFLVAGGLIVFCYKQNSIKARISKKLDEDKDAEEKLDKDIEQKSAKAHATFEQEELARQSQEAEKKEKIEQNIPNDIKNFVRDILSMKKIQYHDNEDVYNKELLQLTAGVHAELEKREKNWCLVLTYNELGENNTDGRIYMGGYLPGNYKAKSYYIEWRFPKKYA